MKKTIVILLGFIIGFLFCITYRHSDLVEGFSIMPDDCPNVLIQDGKKLLLVNKNKAEIPGVNPVVFDNLDEYVQYLKWQRKQGIICPVLYFQGTYDTQGNKGFRALPDPLEPNAGLPSTTPPPNQPVKISKLLDANRDNNPPMNSGGYPGYDENDQNLGLYTPLDKMFKKKGKSDNAMDDGWQGN